MQPSLGPGQAAFFLGQEGGVGRRAQKAPFASDSVGKQKVQSAQLICCFIMSCGSCCTRSAQQGCGYGRNNRASGRELIGPRFGVTGSQDGGNGGLGQAFTVLVPALISGVTANLVAALGAPTPPMKWINTRYLSKKQEALN